MHIQLVLIHITPVLYFYSTENYKIHVVLCFYSFEKLQDARWIVFVFCWKLEDARCIVFVFYWKHAFTHWCRKENVFFCTEITFFQPIACMYYLKNCLLLTANYIHKENLKDKVHWVYNCITFTSTFFFCRRNVQN